MPISRFTRLLITVLMLSPLTALADDDYWDGDRLYLRLGSFFVNNANSTVRLDSTTALGVTLDTTQDLGMNNTDTIARLDTLYRLSPAHSIGLQWYNLRRNGSIDSQHEFEFEGITYPVGAYLKSYLNTAVFKVSYNYSFYHSDKVELAVGAGLHIMRIEVGIEGELVAGNTNNIAASGATVTAPLPVVGAKIVYGINDHWRWIAGTDLFFISLLDYNGQFVDTSLDLEWQFSRHFGLGGGLNANTLGLRGAPETDNRFRLTNNISGLQLYLFARF